MRIDFGYIAIFYLGFRLLLYVFQNAGYISGSREERRTRVLEFLRGKNVSYPFRFRIMEWVFIAMLIVLDQTVVAFEV